MFFSPQSEKHERFDLEFDQFDKTVFIEQGGREALGTSRQEGHKPTGKVRRDLSGWFSIGYGLDGVSCRSPSSTRR